ncbi:hypothetical protein LPJ61_004826 [Coemansia biformis]|uniref:MPN domain-containing protein n=1 Tax=Coemansia biformis TaxID=1286918 RepID=A0A9W7YB30_9FUNG|nr:hypothetical protein LPJ61_004826 [Coemansia biformis]
MVESKQQSKPMTALLHGDTELATFDTSSIPKKLLSVLDVDKSEPLRLVKVDPLAILKIVKHARENFPSLVNGQLLGMEIDGVLEVTNAFAVPTSLSSEEDMTDYQVEMMHCLREVNVDSSSVGWYQSTRLGDFMQRPLLEVQASYQAASPSSNSSVMLIHDTTKSEQSGNLSLRAFRLSQAYLDLAKDGKFTTKDLADKGLTYGNVLEELPVHVEVSSLARVLLSELQWPAGAEQELLESLQRPSSFNAKQRAKRLVDRSAVSDDVDAGADSLDSGLSSLLPTRPAAYLSRPMCTGALSLGQGQTEPALLSRQLETINDLIDKQIQQAHQWVYWKRGEGKEKHRRQQFVQRAAQTNAARVARGEAAEPEPAEAELDRMFKVLPEPSRLDTLLNTANLDLLTKGITQSRGPALTKMFMTQSLHDSSSRPQ